MTSMHVLVIAILYLWQISLMQGKVALEKSKRKKPFPWFPDEGWEDCNRLATDYPVFGSLLDDIEHNEKVWKKVGPCT